MVNHQKIVVLFHYEFYRVLLYIWSTKQNDEILSNDQWAILTNSWIFFNYTRLTRLLKTRSSSIFNISTFIYHNHCKLVLWNNLYSILTGFTFSKYLTWWQILETPKSLWRRLLHFLQWKSPDTNPITRFSILKVFTKSLIYVMDNLTTRTHTLP